MVLLELQAKEVQAVIQQVLLVLVQVAAVVLLLLEVMEQIQ
jgi:hypothetical protein